MFFNWKRHRLPRSALLCALGDNVMQTTRPRDVSGVSLGARDRSNRSALIVLAALCLAQLRLTIILNANTLDEIELSFEVVDVLFLGLENGLEQLA